MTRETARLALRESCQGLTLSSQPPFLRWTRQKTQKKLSKVNLMKRKKIVAVKEMKYRMVKITREMILTRLVVVH